jgi:DnaJ-class molecular chaperone
MFYKKEEDHPKQAQVTKCPYCLGQGSGNGWVCEVCHGAGTVKKGDGHG